MFCQNKCIADTDATNIKEEGGEKGTISRMLDTVHKSEETQYDRQAHPQIRIQPHYIDNYGCDNRQLSQKTASDHLIVLKRHLWSA